MKPIWQVISLLLWVVLSFVPAVVGSQFMPDQWYRELQKPWWNPPGDIFAPVWTMLYALMGVAVWIVWKRAGFAGAGLALTLFILQLVLNGAWTWIFFGLHRPGAALIEIIILWIAILATLISFWQKSAAAGWLLVPYLAWVSFATALTFAIWRLNR
jgi:benzodiazapine receptor